MMEPTTIIIGDRREALGTVMKQDLKSLSTGELWTLHEKITATLATKLAAEKAMLEKRLKLLERVCVKQTVGAPKRRPYPTVFPKFKNPEKPSETWAGRGKQPRWLKKQLKLGKRIDDFRIESVAA
jgi:DNA-binding protein H-NS